MTTLRLREFASPVGNATGIRDTKDTCKKERKAQLEIYSNRKEQKITLGENGDVVQQRAQARLELWLPH